MDLSLRVVGLAAEFTPPRSAQGTGPDQKEPLPLVGSLQSGRETMEIRDEGGL